MCISVTILLYLCTSGIGMYNGLFHSIAISHSFNLFIDIMWAIILLFCPEWGTNSLLCLVTPVVVYKNSDLEKQKILKENKGKSGIYRWTNLVNGSTYIGSAIDLTNRFYSYYNLDHLAKVKMVINRALKKYSHSNFSLEILEYCAKSDVIVREQYYFDLLNPEYNIFQVAGSSLGFKHSLETLEKLSALQTGRVLSEETRAKLSKAHKGKPLSEKALAKLIGRKQSEETKAKMRASALCRLNHNRGKSITVFDKETNETYALIKWVSYQRCLE